MVVAVVVSGDGGDGSSSPGEGNLNVSGSVFGRMLSPVFNRFFPLRLVCTCCMWHVHNYNRIRIQKIHTCILKD